MNKFKKRAKKNDQTLKLILNLFYNNIKNNKSMYSYIYPLNHDYCYFATIPYKKRYYCLQMKNNNDRILIKIYYKYKNDKDWDVILDRDLPLKDIVFEDWQEYRTKSEIELASLAEKLYNRIEKRCGTLTENCNKILRKMIHDIKI